MSCYLFLAWMAAVKPVLRNPVLDSGVVLDQFVDGVHGCC